MYSVLLFLQLVVFLFQIAFSEVFYCVMLVSDVKLVALLDAHQLQMPFVGM
jgi:hypothetical protein